MRSEAIFLSVVFAQMARNVSTVTCAEERSELGQIGVAAHSSEISFPGQGQRVGQSDYLAERIQQCRKLFQSFRRSKRASSLQQRLKDDNFEAPALVALENSTQFTSEWTWIGEIDRFELVKSCQRCLRSARDRDENLSAWVPLNVHELEWVVLAHELGEELLSLGRPAEASIIFEEILNLSVNDVLAYLKLSISQLAAHDSLECASFIDLAHRLRIPQLLRQAVILDYHNSHLRSTVDLLLRIICKEPVAESLLSEGVPRSSGMDMGFVMILQARHQPAQTQTSKREKA
jgi:hypothetical protein